LRRGRREKAVDSSDDFTGLELLIERSVARIAAQMPRGLKSIRTFTKDNDISISKARAELDSGRLEAVKLGKKTMITPEAEAAWRARLPRYRPGTGRIYDSSHPKRTLIDAG
jgi:hypothetical protein